MLRTTPDPTKGLSIVQYEEDGKTVKDTKPLTGFKAQKPADPEKTTGFEFDVKTKGGMTVEAFSSELDATDWRDANNPKAKIQKRKVEYVDGKVSSIGEMELLAPKKAEDKGQTQEVFLPSEKKYVPLSEFLEKATEDQIELYELGGLKTSSGMQTAALTSMLTQRTTFWARQLRPLTMPQRVW